MCNRTTACAVCWCKLHKGSAARIAGFEVDAGSACKLHKGSASSLTDTAHRTPASGVSCTKVVLRDTPVRNACKLHKGSDASAISMYGTQAVLMCKMHKGSDARRMFGRCSRPV